jgi:hypothetical protein
MKRLYFAGLLLAATTLVFATDKKPTPTPPNATSSSTSSASSGDAVSTSNATNGDATGGSALVGGYTSNSDSNLYVLPAPVFVPPMAALPCPAAQIEQEAVAGGWNFFSFSKGRTDTRDCTAIIVINSLIDRCQYGRAQQALDLLAVRALPGFQVAAAGYPDLTPKECAMVKAPPAPPAPVAPIIGPGLKTTECPAPKQQQPKAVKVTTGTCK